MPDPADASPAPEASIFGEARLPLAPVFASVLDQPELSANLNVTIAELCNHEFVSALDPAERARLGSGFKQYLHTLMAEKRLPRSVLALEIVWTPYVLSLFSLSLRKRLRADGPTTESQTIELRDLVELLADDPSALMILVNRARVRAETLATSGLRLVVPRHTRAQQNLGKEAPPQPPARWQSSVVLRTIQIDDSHQLHTTDPRFGWLLHTLLEEASGPMSTLAELASARFSERLPDAPHYLKVLLDRLAAASRMSVQDEMISIMESVRGGARSGQMVLSRYGSDGVNMKLSDVGELYDQTRQSAHRAITNAKRACHRGAYTPALERLMSSVDSPHQQVDHDLRQLLGGKQTLEGAISFAEDFFSLRPGRHPGVEERVSATFPPHVEIYSPLVLPAVLRAARDMAATIGACHWAPVIGVASEMIEDRVERRHYEAVITAHAFSFWLDKERGWASFSDLSDRMHAALGAENPFSAMATPGWVKAAFANEMKSRQSSASPAKATRSRNDRRPGSLSPSIVLPAAKQRSAHKVLSVLPGVFRRRAASVLASTCWLSRSPARAPVPDVTVSGRRLRSRTR